LNRTIFPFASNLSGAALRNLAWTRWMNGLFIAFSKQAGVVTLYKNPP